MSRKKKVAILAGALAALLAVGVAFATWTATGSGSGNAKALGAPATVTVNASTGTADLYPGFTQGALYFTLTNTNPYGITFTAADFSGVTITSSDQPNCPASNVSMTSSSATGLSLHVNGNATSGQESIANVVTMALAAPNGCQNVVFTVSGITLSGAST
jgi:hypothetical protein